MTRSAKFLFGLACLATALAAAAGLPSRQAQAQACCADDIPNDVSFFDVLFTGDPHNLNFTNSSANGNIGIGDTGGFVGSVNPNLPPTPGPAPANTVTGTVEFGGADNPVPPSRFNPDGITVTGGATFGNTNVQTDLNALSLISQTLGGESGTPLTIAGGGSVNASSGMPHGKDRVFTATVDSSFFDGTTFTINGTSSQFVVINVPPVPTTGGFVAFDGSIVLAGGITSDHVLFNFFGGDFETQSGGDTLGIDTGGNITTGIFLDPNGDFHITDTILNGRIFGGDSLDSSITSSNIVADPSFQTPEPTSLALLGAGLGVLGIVRRRRRALARP